MPVKIFGEMKTKFVAEINRDAEIVKAAGWRAEFISAAEVEDEAAIVFELAKHQPGELCQPCYIVGLCFVAVFLFTLERKRRAGENKIDAGIGQRGQQLKLVAAICRSPICEVGGRMFFQQHKSYFKAVDVKASTLIICRR